MLQLIFSTACIHIHTGRHRSWRGKEEDPPDTRDRGTHRASPISSLSSFQNSMDSSSCCPCVCVCVCAGDAIEDGCMDACLSVPVVCPCSHMMKKEEERKREEGFWTRGGTQGQADIADQVRREMRASDPRIRIPISSPFFPLESAIQRPMHVSCFPFHDVFVCLAGNLSPASTTGRGRPVPLTSGSVIKCLKRRSCSQQAHTQSLPLFSRLRIACGPAVD